MSSYDDMFFDRKEGRKMMKLKDRYKEALDMPMDDLQEEIKSYRASLKVLEDVFALRKKDGEKTTAMQRASEARKAKAKANANPGINFNAAGQRPAAMRPQGGME